MRRQGRAGRAEQDMAEQGRAGRSGAEQRREMQGDALINVQGRPAHQADLGIACRSPLFLGEANSK